MRNRSPLSTKRVAIICFEGPIDVNGGVQRRLAAEGSYFAKLEVELTFFYCGKGSPSQIGRTCYMPIPAPAFLYPIRTLFFSIKVSRLLNQFPPFDLIETHHDAGAALLISLLLGKKPFKVWIQFIHGIFLDEFLAILRYGSFFSLSTLQAFALLPLSIVESLAARFATTVVTVSDYCSKKVEKLYHVPKDKIHVIPNGIDSEFFAPSIHTREKANRLTNKEGKVFLYIGRLDPRKGVLNLVQAFVKVHGVYPDAGLEILGIGLQEREIRKKCRKLNLSSVVHFEGQKKDGEILDHYHSAYVVCMPSLQEGQGIVAIEAQACGTPVISTAVGGLKEVVNEGVTGLLVSPGDVQALAEAMLRLASDPDLRNRMGTAAEKWGRQFDWKNQLKKSETLYSTLLA